MAKSSMAAISGLALLAALLAGCRVEKTTHGDSKDVDISTPFGGMHVKTNDADVLASIGLPGYPGAIAVKKDNGNDDSTSADVDMSFAGYQLRVKTASYQTGDAPDKVEAFYRDGLRRYGKVIACRSDLAVGEPARTNEGLTCDNKPGWHVSPDRRPGHALELKAGSPQHQHVVSIDADGGGTKFSLVALDLPGKINSDGESDDTRQ